ncbi:MAG: transcriptional regulator [Thermodesulfobacteria bacterium]|nr:transcriptional regulator [Thermodesulfobacteriota bacterium]
MSIISLIITLIKNVGVLVAAALVLLTFFPVEGLSYKGRDLKTKILLVAFFGLIGIFGTFTGNTVFHSIANLRAMSVITAGLFGGPLVGTCAGLIAGGHRFLIDPWGFSAVACSLATLLEGFAAGLVHKKFPDRSMDWKTGMVLALCGETMHMGLVLLLSRPFDEAVALVRVIALPMITANTLGTGLFLHLIALVYAFKERAESVQAEKIFDIANSTVSYLRDGLNRHSARKTAEIIYQRLPTAAVAITDTTTILAFVGEGNDHHIEGNPVMTQATKEVIRKGEPVFLTRRSQIGCSEPLCPLESAIIVPLRKGRPVVGTLKLYGSRQTRLNQPLFAIAKGLADLLSIQLELEDIQIKDRLLAHARIKHLQAQINPHFLFNSLNTIASFCRTSPDKARELILELSIYMRRNLDSTRDFIRLAEEIEQINSYLAIEKARFGDLIKTKMDIDPKCLDWPIPPLIIQPLVENAIRHGIKPKEGGGTVSINIKRENDFLKVTVSDDGVGMTEKQVKNLLNKSHLDATPKGVGLLNCHNRLVQIYGAEHGIQITSSPGAGTQISFSIPRVPGS